MLNEGKGNYMEKQTWPSSGMEGKGQTRMNNTSDVGLSDPALRDVISMACRDREKEIGSRERPKKRITGYNIQRSVFLISTGSMQERKIRLNLN